MFYKQKYKSIFGAKGLITAPNYLAEQIIKKRIDKKGISIPDCIWNPRFKTSLLYKYWHGAYVGEMINALALLKQYDEDCVIHALESHECKAILSVTNEKLARISREKQEVKDRQEEFSEKNTITLTAVDSVPKPQKGKKSMRGKLK